MSGRGSGGHPRSSYDYPRSSYDYPRSASGRSRSQHSHRGSSDELPQDSPRDRFITIYGRKPVLEALEDPGLELDKVMIARGSRAPIIEQIRSLAGRRGVRVVEAGAERVKLLAGNGRHDQGVLADVVAPGMSGLTTWLEGGGDGTLLLLDGVANPANVGMILRTSTAAGLAGVVLPHRGSPEVGPLVIKASAGLALRASVLRTRTAEMAAQLLGEHGYQLWGLDAGAGTALWNQPLPARVALVLGNETDGISTQVRGLLTGSVFLPMAGGVESLNVASAAAVVCFELARRAGSGGLLPRNSR